MIIVRLMGGLGNQMFQYAFALPHILEGRSVKFDLSHYDIEGSGKFWLEEAFGISLVKAGKRDFFYFMEKVNRGKLGYRLKKGRFLHHETPEQEFTYHPDLASRDCTYFAGYWQNINYFEKYNKQIRDHFKFREIKFLNRQYQKLVKEIANCNSVSIHIRRGDYLSSPIHEKIGIDYYNKAITLITKHTLNPTYFIFSDDVEWTKRNINIDRTHFYIDYDSEHKCYADMNLMSFCKHNIIANSTFSWWAGYLNPNPNKIVVVPSKWFTNGLNINGMLPKSWAKI